MTKVRAHQSREDAAAAGMDPLHWEANHKADELAESAGRRAQLPTEAVQAVLAQDKEAAEVQEHLGAVALQVAKRGGPAVWGQYAGLSNKLRPASAPSRSARGCWRQLE